MNIENPARTRDAFLSLFVTGFVGLRLMSLGVIRSRWSCISYPIHISRPASTLHRTFKLRLPHRTMATEQFLADRAAPLCSLEVAKSFELLRFVLIEMIPDYADARTRTPAPKRRSTRITWPRLPGQVPVSFKANRHHRPRNSTTSCYSLSVTRENWVT